MRLDCPECGYNLHGLGSDVCPECGLKLRLRDFFGAPAEPVPVPPPFLSEPRGAAWGCVPALVVHLLGLLVNGVMFGPGIFRDPLTTVFAVLAAIDVAVIVGVFVFQRRYRLLSVSQRNGLGALCWVWSIAFWVLVCSGFFFP